jgi:hypothetical protein
MVPLVELQDLLELRVDARAALFLGGKDIFARNRGKVTDVPREFRTN